MQDRKIKIILSTVTVQLNFESTKITNEIFFSHAANMQIFTTHMILPLNKIGKSPGSNGT